MSLETELETPVSAEAIEAGKFVTVLTMTSNELIGQLWELINMRTLNEKELQYKQMVIDELKLRMNSHTL